MPQFVLRALFMAMVAMMAIACASPVATESHDFVQERDIQDALILARQGKLRLNGEAVPATRADVVAAIRAMINDEVVAAARMGSTRPAPYAENGLTVNPFAPVVRTTLTLSSAPLPEPERRTIGAAIAARHTLTSEARARLTAPPQTAVSTSDPTQMPALGARLLSGPRALLYHDGTVIDPGRPIHGTSGDSVLRFSLQPSPITTSTGVVRGVSVNLRLGGAEVGALSAPPDEEWQTPLSAKVYDIQRTGLFRTSGRLMLLDTRTQPYEFGVLGRWNQPRLYLIAYRYEPLTGLVVQYEETIALPVAPAISGGPLPWVVGGGHVFAGSIALLPGAPGSRRDFVVTDNFNGTYCSAGERTYYGLCALDSRMAGAVRVGRIQGMGPDGFYEVITPPPPGHPELAGIAGIYPGAHSAFHSVIGDQVCFSVTWSADQNAVPDEAGMGIHCLSRSDLLNRTIPPFAKTGDPLFGGARVASYHQLVRGTPGFGDLTDGVDNDRFHHLEWVYWMRAPADAVNQGCPWLSALRRVNIRTGATELVICDRSFFAWTNEVSSVPSVTGLPVTNILPSVGQEYNNPNLNYLVAVGERREEYFSARMPVVLPF